MAGKNGNFRPPKTSEEAAARGKKGGIASGAARRKKRDMKNAAKLLMDMPVSFENVADQMKNMGIGEEDLTNQMAIMVSMFKEAMAGNVKAATFIRDTIGDGAEGLNDEKRLRMEEKRLQMEEERMRRQAEEKGETGNGMPVIINVRPKDDE